MARPRAVPREQWRIVKGRSAEAPVLDLAASVRLYVGLVAQRRQLDLLVDELRGQILQVMTGLGVHDIYADGNHAIRQTRHLAPELDGDQAVKLLERFDRLREAQRLTLDEGHARQILVELLEQGKIGKDELPFGEPRQIDVLIVRGADDE